MPHQEGNALALVYDPAARRLLYWTDTAGWQEVTINGQSVQLAQRSEGLTGSLWTLTPDLQAHFGGEVVPEGNEQSSPTFRRPSGPGPGQRPQAMPPPQTSVQPPIWHQGDGVYVYQHPDGSLRQLLAAPPPAYLPPGVDWPPVVRDLQYATDASGQFRLDENGQQFSEWVYTLDVNKIQELQVRFSRPLRPEQTTFDQDIKAAADRGDAAEVARLRLLQTDIQNIGRTPSARSLEQARADALLRGDIGTARRISQAMGELKETEITPAERQRQAEAAALARGRLDVDRSSLEARQREFPQEFGAAERQRQFQRELSTRQQQQGELKTFIDLSQSPGDYFTYLSMLRGGQPNAPFVSSFEGGRAIPGYAGGAVAGPLGLGGGQPFQPGGFQPTQARAAQGNRPDGIYVDPTTGRVSLTPEQAQRLGQAQDLPGEVPLPAATIGPTAPTVAPRVYYDPITGLPTEAPPEHLRVPDQAATAGPVATQVNPADLDRQIAALQQQLVVDRGQLVNAQQGQAPAGISPQMMVGAINIRMVQRQAELQRLQLQRSRIPVVAAPVGQAQPGLVGALNAPSQPGTAQAAYGPGLQAAFQGNVVPQARPLPALGAPPFPSAQSFSRLTPAERDIFGSEVKRQGFFLPDYQEQLRWSFPGTTQRAGRIQTAAGRRFR